MYEGMWVLDEPYNAFGPSLHVTCDGDDTVRNSLLEGKARFAVGHWIDVCTDVPVHHDHKAALCMGPHHGLGSRRSHLVRANSTRFATYRN
ncbi:MAG: hypothetical protein Ct9H90mP16_09580 [Candidatus Poseidoniales archaeon]|nr:MAG: hypothetical protein Ct9H90mP16_09580 [Candidatus Poseidoniales archaeon]